MKKFYFVFLFIFTLVVLLLPSCSKKEEIIRDTHDFPFQSKLNVEFDGREYGVNVNIKSESDMTLTFFSPSSLDGLILNTKDGKTTLEYRGINMSIDGEYALNHGILLIKRAIFTDKGSFEGAKIISLSGVKYCRQRYKSEGSVIDVYYRSDAQLPSFIDASINGSRIKITFVNE